MWFVVLFCLFLKTHRPSVVYLGNLHQLMLFKEKADESMKNTKFGDALEMLYFLMDRYGAIKHEIFFVGIPFVLFLIYTHHPFVFVVVKLADFSNLNDDPWRCSSFGFIGRFVLPIYDDMCRGRGLSH